MRAGNEDRQSLLRRLGHGGLFIGVGVVLLWQSFTSDPLKATGLDFLAAGLTGVFFAVTGLVMLMHDGSGDACVDVSAASAVAGPTRTAPPAVASPARYRDVTRPSRPRRTLPRRLPTHR